MALHRERSLTYDGPLREGGGWWVLAAQQFRGVAGYARTKLLVPLLWVAPLVAALLAVAQYVFQGQGGAVEPPGGRGVELFLQMQFYSLALFFAVCCTHVVSHDLRYNTTPLYFSKPIEAWEYSVGKLLGLVGLGSLVTLLPAALVGLLRVALYSQYDLAGPVAADVGVGVGLSLVATVAAAAVLLGISSTTERTGFAILTWLAVVVVPEAAAQIASLSTGAGEYAALMSIQGSVGTLASTFLSGDLAYSSALLAALALAAWITGGVALHVWRLRNLERGL